MKTLMYMLILVSLIFSCGFSQELPMDRLLTEQDLEGLNLEQLYLARNAIFAAHGRPFKTHELNTYFHSQQNYHLDLNYNDSCLSKFEIENASIIRKKELELLKNNFINVAGKSKINFDNIINLRQFGKFSESDREKLINTGFVVAQAKYEQFFFLYENNDYLGIPSFITVDSILQLYHIFYNFMLRNLEEDQMFDIVLTITHEMMKQSEILYKETNNKLIRDATLRNLAFFSVPYMFLTGDSSEVHARVKEIVFDEVFRCKIRHTRQSSMIFHTDNPDLSGRLIDYSQFIPRGHYTRSTKLTNYFYAMMWFGLNSFYTADYLSLVQSLIITKQLNDHQVGDRRLIEYWNDLNEVTEFYVGKADDPGPGDYNYVSLKTFGENPSYNDFADLDKLVIAKRIADSISEKTRIRNELAGFPWAPQFRFMGQRYIPDSEVMQRLTKYPERRFPSGLDVMAAIGSERAKDLQINIYKVGDSWLDYPGELDKLIYENEQLKPKDWKQNLYYNWMYCLKPLLGSFEEPYPFFMRNSNWELKSLSTSLASWAELRHDVILYGKQSSAQCGDGSEWVPDPPKSYVEPNVVFYQRLSELVTSTHTGLEEKGFLSPKMASKFKEFGRLINFLLTVSEKELKGELLTRREYAQIEIFGSLLENFTISVLTDGDVRDWWEIISEVDKNVAVIADVHTSLDEVLEVGPGAVNEIYVIIQIGDYLKLTRGAVFSYYEFKHQARDRLTDEKWQQMLKSGENPPLPSWQKPFMSDKPLHKLPKPRYTYFSGC